MTPSEPKSPCSAIFRLQVRKSPNFRGCRFYLMIFADQKRQFELQGEFIKKSLKIVFEIVTLKGPLHGYSRYFIDCSAIARWVYRVVEAVGIDQALAIGKLFHAGEIVSRFSTEAFNVQRTTKGGRFTSHEVLCSLQLVAGSQLVFAFPCILLSLYKSLFAEGRLS